MHRYSQYFSTPNNVNEQGTITQFGNPGISTNDQIALSVACALLSNPQFTYQKDVDQMMNEIRLIAGRVAQLDI